MKRKTSMPTPRRRGRAFPALAACAALACLPGCATVTREGAGSGKSAAEQSLEAKSLERALSPLAPLFAGNEFSIVVSSDGSPEDGVALEYAASVLREAAVSAGGRYIEGRRGELLVEMYAAGAGSRATERNLVVSLGDFVRVPVLYSESLLGESGIVVLVRDRDGKPVPLGTPPDSRRGDGEYYLFRVIGPIRR
ncbi:MAG: hypothetical protein ACM31I_11475 [Deltaproteobacteria bacterium]